MSNAHEGLHRSGPGQGSHIFWGALSLIFAAAACYFFWQNSENELAARTLKDQETLLQLENQQLKAQVDKLQSNMAQVDILLKNREEKLKEQATSLAQVTEKTQQLDAEKQEAERQKKARAEANDKLREALATLANGKDIVIVQRKETPTLRIQNTALFNSGEMTLRPEIQTLLKKLAAIAQPQLKDHALRLESFTDSDPIAGSLKAKYPSNLELSSARAAAVARYFTNDIKVPIDRVVAVGRGEQYPVGPNTTKEGRAQNRRLEILLEPLDLSATEAAPTP